MDGNGFFKFFAGILIIGMIIFWFLNSKFEFECPLPKSGYYHVKWDRNKNRFDVFYWQPKKKIKQLPKDSIYIEGETEPKPEKHHL